MQCYRRSMKILYTEHVTNEEVPSRVQRKDVSIAKDFMLGPMPGKRRQGGQKRQLVDDLKEWTGLTILDLISLT